MQASAKVSQREATASGGAPVTILAFTGDIASTSNEVIMDAYQGLGSDVKNVLLDFTKVEYINSSGIAIIIQVLLDASKNAGRVVGIFGLTPHFVKVFTMVGVAKYATISADEATALSVL
jgi:anti-anti-sigma factor